MPHSSPPHPPEGGVAGLDIMQVTYVVPILHMSQHISIDSRAAVPDYPLHSSQTACYTVSKLWSK
jgi:hypothetical protein